MEDHMRLSLAIAVSDLKYVCGMLHSSGTHPRSWAFSHWGTTVAFETLKHLSAAHETHIILGWEPKIAAAARNGGKFFEGNRGQFKRVIKDFRQLIEATHAAYFAADRIGPEYDFLRDDFAVLTDGDDLLLTNVTGHFMVGLPANRGSDMEEWGPHLRALNFGIGQLTRYLAPSIREELHLHGAAPAESLSWWDGRVEEFVSGIFSGELKSDLAFSLVSILSTLQCAGRWARTDCCVSCQVAALKHRFVVLYHALSSLGQLRSRTTGLGPIAEMQLSALVDTPRARTLVDRPFRSLRNGWLHLGFSDIAIEMRSNVNFFSPIRLYTGMEPDEFATFVDEGIDETTADLQSWMSSSGNQGASYLDCLVPVEVD